MAQSILLKRSSVAGNVPDSSDLSLGEIAINTADGAVYIKKGNNDIVAVHDNDILHIDTTNSRVGIGKTNPNYELDVNGGVNIASGSVLRWGSGDVEIVNSSYNLLFKTYDGSSSLVEHMRITSAGKVGIGTSSLTNKFHVSGDARIEGSLMAGGAAASNVPARPIHIKSSGDAAAIRIEDTTSSNLAYDIRSTHGTGLLFVDVTNSATRMTIGDDGNVGIGTTNPQGKLDVDGDLRVTRNIVSNTVYQMLSLGSDRTIDDYGGLNKDYWRINLATPGASTDGGASAHAYGTLIFSGVTGSNTTYADRMAITAGGNVGIGTTSPAQKLDVRDGDITTRDSTNTNYAQLSRYVGLTLRGNGTGSRGVKTPNTDALTLGTNNTERVRILSDGKVIINDTASHTTDLLQIETPASGGGHGIQIRRNDANNDQGIGHILFGNNTDTDLVKISAKTDLDSNAGDSGALLFSTQPTSGSLTERMRIDSSGNVGIGDTAPSFPLDVNNTSTRVRFKATTGHSNLELSSLAGRDYLLQSLSNGEFTIHDEDSSANRLNISTAGAITFNNAYTFPTADGSANQVLQTDGSGNLSFATVSGGGGVTISNNTNNRVLTGDGTNANAEANLTFDGSTLDVTGAMTSTGTITSGGQFTSASGDVTFRRAGSSTARILIESGNTTSGQNFITNGKITSNFSSSHTTGTISYTNAALDLFNTLEADTDEKGSILTFSDNYYDGSYNKTTRAAIKGGTDTTGNTANGFLAFYTDSGAANTANERMRIDSSGNVGINSTNPGYKLDVGGSVRFAGSASIVGTLQSYSGAFYIKNIAQDQDIIFQGNDGGSTITSLTLDMSNSGAATFNAAVIAPSTYSQNFYVTSSGTTITNRIDNDGTYMYISYGGSSSRAIQVHNTTGDVRLNYGASTKLTTFASGVDITGELQSDSLDVDGNADISGNLVLGGNLTVNGTSTTLNTATLDVEDKNITLNKGSGDTSGSADGAGITIQDAVDASTDATILWDASNDEFDFSHKINVNGGALFNTNTGSNPVYITRSGATDQALKIYTDDANVIFESIQDESLDNYGGFVFSMDSGTTHPFFDVRKGTSASDTKLRVDGSGNVGIGETSPQNPLHVRSDSASGENYAIQIDNNNTTVGSQIGMLFRSRVGTTNTDFSIRGIANGTDDMDLTFNSDGGSERLRITKDGNVGIGTTTPSGKLHVYDSGTDTYGTQPIAIFDYYDTDDTALRYSARIGDGATTFKTFVTSSATDFLIQDQDNQAGRLAFQVTGNAGSNQILAAESTGKVGIGTITPNCALHVNGQQIRIANGNPILTLQDTTDDDDHTIRFQDNGGTTRYSITSAADDFNFITNGARDITFQPNDSEAVRITSAGKVGIGTTSPQSTLHVESPSDDGSGMRISRTGSSGYMQLYPAYSGIPTIMSANAGLHLGYNSNTAGIRIHTGNKVGVNQTAPKASFQVEEYGIDTTETSSTATTQIAIHTFAATDFRSARFTVQVTNSTDSTYHTTELLLVHDGTTANITEFGEIHTGSAVEATFDADVLSGNVRLLATPASTDTMAFKVVCHSITT